MLLPKNANRNLFIEHMRYAGVQTSIHYPPIHCFSYYRERYPGLRLPWTERAAAREITLPLYPTMTIEDADYVISAANDALAYTLPMNL